MEGTDACAAPGSLQTQTGGAVTSSQAGGAIGWAGGTSIGVGKREKLLNEFWDQKG